AHAHQGKGSRRDEADAGAGPRLRKRAIDGEAPGKHAGLSTAHFESVRAWWGARGNRHRGGEGAASVGRHRCKLDGRGQKPYLQSLAGLVASPIEGDGVAGARPWRRVEGFGSVNPARIQRHVIVDG